MYVYVLAERWVNRTHTLPSLITEQQAIALQFQVHLGRGWEGGREEREDRKRGKRREGCT